MKKVLCFVLVLAMVLGSVAMVFATDFTDQASITNTEASKVLSAIGVIEGYTDGSFKPAGILTRAEGAAIAARMLLGKAEAAKLTTVVGPFKDVPASHWASGYISYCVSQGILNGYGDGNFGPEDTLTVAAFGKMMLTALGYKSENEGFVGDAWETNVGSAMVKAGLTDGVTTSGTNSCNREVAAQVALNTLKADIVWYDGTPITVNAGNVSVTTGQSAAKTVGPLDNGYDATTNDYCKHNGDTKMQFMEKHFKDLDLNVSAEAFGRPGVYEWKFENKKAATTKSDVKKIASYTTKQTHKTLYAMLDENSLVKDNIQVIYKLDGADVVASGANQDVKAWVAGWKNDADTSLGTKGTQIEVYYDGTVNNTIGSKGIVTIVAYNYYLVQASADYNESKKSVKVTEVSPFVLDTDSKELKADDYAVTGVLNEDYLIVTAVLSAGKYTVKSVAPATKVTGTISAYTKGSNITVDGTKYNASSQFDSEVGVASAFDGLAANSNLTLVLDPNSFVLKTTDEQSSNQYVYIRNAVPESGLNSKYIADAYFTDGTKQEITLKNATEYAKFDSDGPNVVGYGTGNGPAWYNYSVEKDGKYKLTKITNEAAGTGVVVNAGKVAYVTGKASATATTQFIVRKDNGDVLTYTGYKNVPGTTSGHFADTRAVLTNDGYAKVVFIQLDNNSVKGSSTSDYLVIYKTGAFDTNKDADGDYYSYAKTIVNGTKKDVTFSDTADFQATATTLQADLYTDIAYDADGKITDGTALIVAPAPGADRHFNKVAGVSTASGSAITVAYKTGVLTVNGVGYELADSVAVFVIEGSNVDETSISSFKNSLDEAKTYTVYLVYTNDTDNIVKAVYAIETGNF
jgi:hypothetical protein